MIQNTILLSSPHLFLNRRHNLPPSNSHPDSATLHGSTWHVCDILFHAWQFVPKFQRITTFLPKPTKQPYHNLIRPHHPTPPVPLFLIILPTTPPEFDLEPSKHPRMSTNTSTNQSKNDAAKTTPHQSKMVKNLPAFEKAVTTASNSIKRCGEIYCKALSLLQSRMQVVSELHVQVKELPNSVFSPIVTESIENTETNHPLPKDADSNN